MPTSLTIVLRSIAIMSDEKWEEVSWGYWAQRDRSGTIIALREGYPELPSRHVVRLNQEVTANGRICVPAGTKGIVRRLSEPGTDVCTTTNVIYVQWHSRKHCDAMKFKDLQF